MELTDFWDKLTDGIDAGVEGFTQAITSLFGSSNERQIRRMRPIVARIGELEPRMQALSDTELRELTPAFRQRLAAGASLEDLLVEAFAAVREAGRRFLNMRHYDVQMMGGIVLHRGMIAEMVTGEGKTLVATPAVYLNALTGRGVHVVTVNDYLARRDAEWMSPLYRGLGMTVGAIQSAMDPGGEERRQQYHCDITYGTNNEFGFDYLRDNMKPSVELQCQRDRYFAVIDEVDNILIDEARTPLIISGPAFDDTRKYYKANQVALVLKPERDFEIKEKEKTCHLTDEGVRHAEQLVGVESFYTPGNMEWPHLLDNALKAHHLYKRDKDYVVINGEVIIVDEFTGRLMEGRQWSDGLHQAVEAKEGVHIKEETQTLATITFQNFFKLYEKLAGMTGTAMTEASEFWKIYKLDVIAIPTNQPLIRVSHPDVIFRSEREKFQAIVEEIREVHVAGRPVLIGTTSIEKSERLSEQLKRFGIGHEVLNAKPENAGREAEIVAQAGRRGAVTLATNMAGRGTDIILGGSPDAMAWSELKHQYGSRLDVPPEVWAGTVAKYSDEMKKEGREVAELGGLHIIGTERHEARRVDNQLRGRAGRQGDPGTSRFFLSLEDDLMRIFAGEWVRAMLTRLGMEEGQAIESGLVSRRIAGAQKKVEEHHFEIRKNLLEYDEVMDQQRKQVYSYRQDILQGANCKQLILEMIDAQVRGVVTEFTDPLYGPATFAQWASQRLGIELEPKRFKDLTFEEAADAARDAAQGRVETQVLEALDENLPSDADPGEWQWQGLATQVNTRWGMNLRDRDLKKVGREDLDQYLIDRARDKIQQIDLAGGAEFLDPDWGLKSVVGWARHKFGMELTPDELRGKPIDEVCRLIQDRARAIYAEKEIEFPVQVGMARFMAEHQHGNAHRYDREGLVHWANQRFNAHIGIDLIRLKNKVELHDTLHELSKAYFPSAEIQARIEEHLERVFGPEDPDRDGEPVPVSSAALDGLIAWARDALGAALEREELAGMGREQVRGKLQDAVDDRYRSEMREMERALVLQILDTSWKDHLYAMDHLRSSIGLTGYAQLDPKVEYKREGMKIFRDMWTGVQDKVTNLVFKMEQVDVRFLSSLWQMDRAVAIHEDAQASTATDGIRAQQEAAMAASQRQSGEPVKQEPVRHRGPRVGRNDPCPCGSGKKYKHCHMRTQGQGVA